MTNVVQYIKYIKFFLKRNFLPKYDLAVHILYQISLRGPDSHGHFFDYNNLLKKKISVFDGRSNGQFGEHLASPTDL